MKINLRKLQKPFPKNLFVTGGLFLFILGLCFLVWQSWPEIAKKDNNQSLEVSSNSNVWETYSNGEHGFKFQYPSDFIIQPSHYDFVAAGPRGDMILEFKEGAFDSKRIEYPFDRGFYFQESELEKVKIDSGNGYIYEAGDGGGLSKVLMYQFKRDTYLIMYFSSCIDDTSYLCEYNPNPIVEDVNTMEKIISTFEFDK